MTSHLLFPSPIRNASLSLVHLILFFNIITTAAAYKPLSDSFLRHIASGDSDFDPQNSALLSPILRPRAPGTEGHATVQAHFVNFFATHLPQWELAWQNSTAIGGGGEVPIANLVFRREPPWTGPGQANLLTLVAHYDSRSFGATGAAMPCALMLHVARSLDRYAQQMYDEMKELGEGGTVAMDMGVQVMLLDGTEPLRSPPGGADDGLYGSRSLAAQWENTTNPAMTGYGYPNRINEISLLVQLDQLGAAGPNVSSAFATTHWAYRGLAVLETRLRRLGLLETRPAAPFLPDAERTQFVAPAPLDDHSPFAERGVPVLRVVPSPPPLVWGTADDDGAHLDLPTVRDWARIVTAFAFEWLDMAEVEPRVAEGERARRRVGRGSETLQDQQ